MAVVEHEGLSAVSHIDIINPYSHQLFFKNILEAVDTQIKVTPNTAVQTIPI
jgi:hypothetical protein